MADAAQDAVAAMGPSMGLVEEDDTLDQAPDDEITSLLRHEKTNQGEGASGIGDSR